MKKLITASAIFFLFSCTKESANKPEEQIKKPTSVRVVAVSLDGDSTFTTVIYAR